MRLLRIYKYSFNDGRGSGDIVGHIIGGHRPAGFNLSAVPGADEERGGAGVLSEFNINRLIPNDKALRRIEAMLAPRLLKEAGVWLAAGAAVIGMVRTYVYTIKPYPLVCQELVQPRMHAVKRRRIKKTAADAGLVGCDGKTAAEAGKFPEGLRRPGNERYAIGIAQVIPFHNDGAVTIKEYEGAAHTFFSGWRPSIW